ncbi:MAG: bifunctional riboflavin kinase/FAD synthetase [Cytophagales bacterium]
MIVHQGLQELSSSTQTVVTIGSFDGMHLAHRKIATLVKQEAKRLGIESAVITFWPHPRTILNPNSTHLLLLTTPDEKQLFLEEIGIDHLYIIPFTLEFSNWTAEHFVNEIFVKRLKTKKIILGFDHHFGKNREGNLSYLKSNQSIFNIEVEAIEEQIIHDATISSTEIRNALKVGQIEIANELLGYPYQFSGKVMKGNQMGRTIGFPTANIFIKETYKLIPANGVYAVLVKFNKTVYQGMMNIGLRPTLNGSEKRIEVNIFDFDQDIYGETLTILMRNSIREERKFESFDLLKDQISLDKTQALAFLST